MRTGVVLLAGLLCLGLVACESESDAGGDAALDQGRTDGGADDAASVVLMPTQDVAVPDAAVPDAAPADAGPACEVLCFSNNDCAEGTRCENTADEGELEVPCCLPGERGTRAPGEDCSDGDGQFLCASGVCVEGDNGAFCSTTCEEPIDCPPNMGRCFPIGFDDGRDPETWCFPG